MLVRTFDVRFDPTTFPGGVTPPQLVAGPHHVDMRTALLSLGSITIPNGLSIASPALHWAWLRYFSAISIDPTLRITTPFSEMDPHLKSVLSDDFGVAVTMQWLSDTLGGFRDVVNGRQFALHYGHLLNQPVPPLTKIGPQKCPDFVVLDNAGRWHVMECKGTQTSVRLSDTQLARAREQKAAIAIDPGLAGFSLAVGLYVPSETDRTPPRVMVHDPADVSPIVRLADRELADNVVTRLSVANGLGLAGYSELADELALVVTKDKALESLTTAAERRRSAIEPTKRLQSVAADFTHPRQQFRSGGRDFVGTQVSIDMRIPALGNSSRKVTVKHGVERGYLEELRATPAAELVVRVEESKRLPKGARHLTMVSTDADVSIEYGDIFASSLTIE